MIQNGEDMTGRSFALKRDFGFSLIELMIVIAIIGIMAAIATPGLIRWRDRANHRGIVQQFAADLHRGKLRAVRENSPVVVQYTTSGYTMCLDSQTAGTIGSCDAGDVQLSTVQWPSHYNMTTDSTNNIISFQGRGIADVRTIPSPAAASEIFIRIDDTRGNVGTIRINPLARIAMQ